MILQGPIIKWTFLLLAVGAANMAFAGLISSTSTNGSGGSRALGVTDDLRFQIGHGQLVCDFFCVPDFDPASTWLDIEVDDSDVGSTFSADLTGFPLLFNGINENTLKFVSFFGSVLTSGPEASLIFGSGNGGARVDLAGFTLTHVDFRLDDLTITSPGSDPNGDGIWTEYSYAYTLDFYGNTVPAPATFSLFGLGIAGLAWSRRKA